MYKRFKVYIQRGAFQEIKEFDNLIVAIEYLSSQKEGWLYELIYSKNNDKKDD